mgnify:CR=1 FL=1
MAPDSERAPCSVTNTGILVAGLSVLNAEFSVHRLLNSPPCTRKVSQFLLKPMPPLPTAFSGIHKVYTLRAPRLKYFNLTA